LVFHDLVKDTNVAKGANREYSFCLRLVSPTFRPAMSIQVAIPKNWATGGHGTEITGSQAGVLYRVGVKNHCRDLPAMTCMPDTLLDPGYNRCASNKIKQHHYSSI
jgi:hypothetical protein